MKKFIAVFWGVTISISLMAQNVGIGTTSPLARLHVGGPGAQIRVDDGPLMLYNTSTDEFTRLVVAGSFSVMQNNYTGGSFLFRPAVDGLRDIVMNGNGISILSRGAISPSMVAQVPLDIRNNGEGIRLSGTTPYITLYDGANQRGYLQAWTDGIALASAGYDVGLWTNGVKRLSVKPNGALEINGSTGSSGQVLTSNGAGAPPSWTNSANNALYNSFRFVTLSQPGFTCTNDNNWRDIPGMSSTLAITGNTYVDVAANMCYFAGFCVGCDNPTVEFKLVVNATDFCFMKDRTGGTDLKTKSLTTGFTLPAGTHTLKWQMRCTDGSSVTVINSDSRAVYPSFMRVWTVSQ